MDKLIWQLGLGLAAAVLSGCGTTTGPRQVRTGDFYARPPVPEEALSPVDHPGSLPLPDAQTPSDIAPPRASAQQPLDPTAIMAAAANSTTQPATAIGGPSTQPGAQAALAPGQYMELGGVVAVVNGTPIFANQVLRRDEALLREDAQQDDLDQFRTAAIVRIRKTVEELIGDEERFAAADRTLDSKFKNVAWVYTSKWRDDQINQAGGSIELARRKALAAGHDFQDDVKDYYRLILWEIYLSQVIYPQVQVTANEKRDYYQKHVKDEFTVPDSARVYIIDVDGKDPELVRSMLTNYRKLAQSGTDFGKLAEQKSQAGFRSVLSVERDSLRYQKVEAAIWKMSPGQISDIIEDDGGFFLVKVIERQVGGVRPFTDEAVQDAISNRLQTQKQTALQDSALEKLKSDSISIEYPVMLNATLDMAMQNYPQWSRRPAATQP